MKKLILFLCLFVAAVPAIAQNEWRDSVTDIESAHIVRQKHQVIEGNQLVGGNIITKEYGTAKLWQAVWQAWQNGEFTPGGTFSEEDSTKLDSIFNAYQANALYDDSEVIKYTDDQVQLNGIFRTKNTRGLDAQITIIADDGHKDDSSWVFPLQQAKDINISHAIISSRVGVLSDYLTPSGLQMFTDFGDDIIGHSYSHKNLTTLDSTELYRELVYSQYQMDSLGFPVKSFVAPYGAVNANVRSWLRDYYNANVVTQTSYNNTSPINSYYLKRFSFDGYSLDSAKKVVADAIAKKYWLIVAIHPGFPEYDRSGRRDTLGLFFDYIKDSVSIPIRTFTEAYSQYANPYEQGDMGINLNGSGTSVSGSNYTVISKEGKLISSEIIYIKYPTNYKGSYPSVAEAPPTEWPLGKIAFQRVQTASAQGMPDNLAGTLTTYNNLDPFSHQTYVTYNEGVFYTRYWTGTSWSSWIWHGSFGIGGQKISTEVDFDNYQTGGIYITPISGLINSPDGLQGRHTLIVAGGETYGFQLVVPNISGDLWWRDSFGSTFSPWKQVSTFSGNPSGLNQEGATTGQVIKWDGAQYSPAVDEIGATEVYVDSIKQFIIDSLINYIDSALTNTETRYETQDRLLRESDAGGRFVSNSTVNHTITIPTGLTYNYGQVGIDFEAWNTGKLILDCSSVSVYYRDDPNSRVLISGLVEIWQGATLRPIAPDTYILIGSFSE